MAIMTVIVVVVFVMVDLELKFIVGSEWFRLGFMNWQSKGLLKW